MQIADGRFVITGGGSQVGSHLAEQLVDQGAREVVLVDNLSLGVKSIVDELLTNDKITFVRGDVLRIDQLLEVCRGTDGVFSLAALLTMPLSRDPIQGVQVNVNGVLNTLEACRAMKVKKCVLASSIAVYGDQAGKDTREDTPLGTSSVAPPFGLYALSKLTGEQLGRLYSQRHEVDFSSVRFATVYGARQHDRAVNAVHILEAYESIRAGEAPRIVGSGDEVHDYLHVTDAARGAIRAMEVGGSGAAYNIATGVSTSVRELIELVIDECGADVTPVHEADQRQHRGTTHTDLSLNIDKAKKELDWTAKTDLRRGIRGLIEWRRATAEAF